MGIDLGLLALRLVLGFFLAGHGLQKVSHLFGGEGLDGGSREFADDGFRGGRLTALAAGGGQILAGVLFLFGALTPVAAATATGVMAVALTVKATKGLWVQHDGIEYPLVLVILSIALGLTGPGAWSVDALLGLTGLPGWVGLAAAALGLGGAAAVRLLLHRPVPTHPESRAVEMTVSPVRSRIRPRARLGRRGAFLAMALTFALLTTGGTLPIPLYTLWGAELGFDASVTTWIFAIYVLGTLLALVVAGGLSDQVGRRPLIIASVLITVASAVLFLIGGSVAVLLIARLLSGIGVGLITSAVTAGLAEAYEGENTATPQVVSTVANMGGLGLGPLLAGVFAQYLVMPTMLVFIVFLALTVIATVFALLLPETNRTADPSRLRARLNIGVPRSALGVYVRAAFAVVPTFTLLGLFSSLTPRFIAQSLDVHNLAVAGLATFVLFEIGVIAQLLGRRFAPRVIVLVGLPILIASLALVLIGFETEQLAIFAIGTVLGGFGAGLTFSGGLRAVGSAVPHALHARSVATYFVAAQGALAVPILTIGGLAAILPLQIATRIVLLAVIALAAVALIVNLVPARRTDGSPRE
ncbi:MFS transporter [Microbacterium stercoris]|uniref:MFS transporter n=1 Tax=Microbacterium stercoris TaxID=2820289 RepID=A0A939QK32_9MICO|nr:MFS transporter [Microbacterium stercoris]MBO3663147.1 MFS transporter [Microbacterium stercoris]